MGSFRFSEKVSKMDAAVLLDRKRFKGSVKAHIGSVVILKSLLHTNSYAGVSKNMSGCRSTRLWSTGLSIISGVVLLLGLLSSVPLFQLSQA